MQIIRKHIDPKPIVPPGGDKLQHPVQIVLPPMYDVFILEWEESERGWGTRFDGISVHLNEEEAKEFLRKYWLTLPNEVPEEYERPTRCEGWWAKITDQELYKELVEKTNVRLYKHTDTFKKLEQYLYENHMWHGCYMHAGSK